MMGFGLVFVLLLVGAAAYVGGWRPQFSQPAGWERPVGGHTALDLARERYARGEITRAEYGEICETLAR